MPNHTNRLITETSRYLQQHAHNPVDWYPWGAEALHQAQTQDKPILLSIGYSACHWCHVMEHESFEDVETATLMNRHFINIKVDREERPDIDALYMAALVAMRGQGGWPLNIFLLPDGTPFFAGTYFPPDGKAARYGMPSFKEVLSSIVQAYQSRRHELQDIGQNIVAHLDQRANRFANPPGHTAPALTTGLLDHAFAHLQQDFDPTYGGFGSAPKFPQPMNLEYVLRYATRTGHAEALAMVEQTLTQMARGGIYDHIGGGFHRYSVDQAWKTPHFEKMLYDNALLARLYTEAYQVTGTPRYRRIAEETLDYTIREMRHPQGGFFSTQDADTEGQEGRYYTWTLDQIRQTLGADAPLFSQVFGITAQGNFEGTNIVHQPYPIEEIARITGTTPQWLDELIQRGRTLLYQTRLQRPRPARDEKILTAWNGMQLRALALAAAVFHRSDYLAIAQQTAQFLLTHLRRSDGRTLHTWSDTPRPTLAIPGYLEDDANLADGLLTLYMVDGDERWLRACISITDSMVHLFWDSSLNGFYDTATDHEQLIIRPRDIPDNATPSGSSVAVEHLLRLSALTDNDTYHAHAHAMLANLTNVLRQAPAAFGRLLCAADFLLAPTQQLALVGDAAHPTMQAMQRVVYQTYRPYLVVAYQYPDTPAVPLPLLQERPMINQQPTAYLCQQATCSAPITDADTLHHQFEYQKPSTPIGRSP
jgi:uncharacterized protein